MFYLSFLTSQVEVNEMEENAREKGDEGITENKFILVCKVTAPSYEAFS
jgi:hypothetical protein